MIRRLLFILTLSALVHTLGAQEITVSAPTQVAAGENFRIAYTINTQDVDEFRAGNVPSGLEVLAGPYSSVQRSYQMINGRSSSSSSVTYTYTLYAEKNGTYTIPPAHAKIGGKTITSRSIQIKVSGTAAKSNGAPRMHGESDEPMRSVGSKITGKDLFVKVTANKRRVHEQEPILLTYKVYTLVDLTSLDGKMPDLTGFHTQQIELPLQKSWHVEKVNGRNYRCVTWSQYVMYPQMTGKLKIPAITFKGNVVLQNRAVDPFEAFFNGGSGYEEVKRDIVAPSLEIQVDPLPNKPVGFSGGVGKLSITASVDKKNVKAGDPITLRVVVGGVGNLKLLKQPTIVFPKDFDKYDPKVTDKTRLTTNGIEGNMIYDYLAVPRNQGKYTIPSINFIYYDTSSNTYKTLHTSPIAIDVAKGDGTSNSGINYAKETENDIRQIKTGNAELRDTGSFFFESALYWVLLLVPLAAFVALFVIFRKRALDNADIVKMKGKKANKTAVKRLKKAFKLMSELKQSEFYDEILRTLWGYVSDKLNMPLEQLSRENISENLVKGGVKIDTIDKFMYALDECEFERYAPGDAKGNMDKTYSSAMAAITDIEESLNTSKRKRKHQKTVVVLIAMLMSPMLLYGVTKTDGDREYRKGNYQQAIAIYNDILKKGANAEIYYNLGNAYYRTENLPKAILAYERAREIAPGDRDIKFNLQFVRNKTIDKIMPPNEMFFVTFYKSMVSIMSVDHWAYLSVFMITASMLLLLLYLFCSRILARKIGFYGALVCFVAFLFSVLFAYQQKKMLQARDAAIVIAPALNVKKTPAEASEDVFTIHEGTKVNIIDKSMKTWWNVELDDGREGWIKSSQAEEI